MDIANDILNFVREVVNDQLSQEDATVICKITGVHTDGTVDIAIVPDLINTFTNINNETKHQFQVGDYAILYKIDNKINNSFIIAAINPTAIDNRTAVADSQDTEEFKNELKEYIKTQIQGLNISGGGSGGETNDYTQLANKPQINKVLLTGNKTSADLGLVPAVTSAGYKVYADLNGKQGTYNVSDSATATTIALRNSDGTLNVSTPVDNSNAATKGYVDSVTPTVNNNKLTIQKNGETVAEFTANSSVDVNADLIIPTVTSTTVTDGTNTLDISGKVDKYQNLGQNKDAFYSVYGASSTQGVWKGTLNGLTAYYDGLKICYTTDAVVGTTLTTLQLNLLDAKSVYINNTNKLIQPGYPIGSAIPLTYVSTLNGGLGGWLALNKDFDELYYCTAYITEYNDIHAAITNKRFPICKYEFHPLDSPYTTKVMLPYAGNITYSTQPAYYFTGIYDNIIYKVRVNSSATPWYVTTSTIPTRLSDLTDDSTHRVVTDTQINTWNTVTNKLDATATAVNSDKLDGYDASYFYPASNPAGYGTGNVSAGAVLPNNKIIIGANSFNIQASNYDISDIIAAAEGKTKTYITSIVAGYMPVFNTDDNYVALNASDYFVYQYSTGVVIEQVSEVGFKAGDIILIEETQVSDRWFSHAYNNKYYFYKLETSKVDLGSKVDKITTGSSGTIYAYTANVTKDPEHAGQQIITQTQTALSTSVYNDSTKNTIPTTQAVYNYAVPQNRTINMKPLSADVYLNASDVNALPSDTVYVTSVNGESGVITGIAKTSEVNAKVDKVESWEYAAYIHSGTNQTTLKIVTDAADALTLVRRDANGEIITATPTTNASAATKQYVDNHHDLPSGGTTGQVLSKVSNSDYDTSWVALPNITSTDVEITEG